MVKTHLVCLFIGLLFVFSVLFPARARAGVGVTPTALSFGSVTVGANSTAAIVTITNNGGQATTIQKVTSSCPEFIVMAPALPISMAPRSSVSFQVVFKPDVATTFSGSIVITPGHKGGGQISVGVSGAGTTSSSPAQTSLLSTSATGLNFGNLLVGSSASQAFRLTNTGTGSVNVSQVAATGAGFTVTGFSGGVTLAAGASLPLTANFAPAVAGAVAGSISVVSSATNSPPTIALSGTGIQPQISVIPSSISFGSVTVGVTNTQTITIRNAGTATLTVTQASLAGTGFTSSGLVLPLSIPAGGSSAFTAGFTPASAGTFSGSITFLSNTANSPLVVPFSGTGIAATLQLSASPASLSFGSLTTGASASETVTLTNTGNSSVSISQLSASGTGFSANGIALPLGLAVGQSTSFSVTFAPASAGSLSGSVTVLSNATNSPLVIALSGTGASGGSHTVSLSWTPGSSTYSGFNVYRGTASGGPYARVDTSVISATSYLDSSVSSGQTYYYVATEVDTTGTESGYSSEVSAVVP